MFSMERQTKCHWRMETNRQTFVKRPYKTRHTICLSFPTGGCFLMHQSSAESSILSPSNKQPPVDSDNHVTKWMVAEIGLTVVLRFLTHLSECLSYLKPFFQSFSVLLAPPKKDERQHYTNV